MPLAPFDTVPNATPRLRFAATNPGNPGQGEGNFGTPSVYLLRLLTRCDRTRPRRNCTLHVAARNIARRRLNESLKILDAPARATHCKGMTGLIEEGEEVISEGKEKDDVPADLALIGAAQRVEHYEIAAYTTARNLALQLRQPTIVQLLTTSLGEEQNAGQLLDQVARPLMSVAKMPASVE